jgi:hypothetical protein
MEVVLGRTLERPHCTVTHPSAPFPIVLTACLCRAKILTENFGILPVEERMFAPKLSRYFYASIQGFGMALSCPGDRNVLELNFGI